MDSTNTSHIKEAKNQAYANNRDNLLKAILMEQQEQTLILKQIRDAK